MRRPSKFSGVLLLRRAGMTLPVITEIRSRGRIVGLVPLRAIGHGIIAGRGRFGDYGVVVIIGVIVIIGAAVVAIGRPDACADREAWPEAAVTMAMMEVTATVPAATRDSTSTNAGRGPDNAGSAAFRAGNGTRPELATSAWCYGHATTPGCNGHAATSGRNGHAGTSARCNGHAATSNAATAGRDGAAATTSKATAAADSPATADSRAAASGTAASAFLSLGGANACRDYRQHERHGRGCAQNFQLDHYRLHLRDIGPNPFRGRTFPSPRIDCAQAERVRPELYAA
jgi:hypothetical protein